MNKAQITAAINELYPLLIQSMNTNDVKTRIKINATIAVKLETIEQAVRDLDMTKGEE